MADIVQIRVELDGGKEVVLQARQISGAISGTGKAATTTGAQTSRSARGVDRLKRAWGGLTSAARLGALGLAGAGAVVAFQTKQAVAETLELTKATAGLSDRTGFSTKASSEWAAVAKVRGIAATSLSMGFKTLGAATTEAAEGDEAYLEQLKKIGLSQEDAKKGLEDSETFVRKVAEGLAKMPDGFERTTVAAKLFGRGYATLLPLFNEGAKSVDENLELADKYNVTLGKDGVEANMALVSAQRESQFALMGLKQALATAVIPTLTDAHGEFQTFVQALTDPKLSTEEKLSVVGDKLKTGFATAFGWVTQTALPEFATQIGEKGPMVAGALVRGFLNAGIWGKLFIAGWLTRKIVFGAVVGKVASGAAALATAFGRRFMLVAGSWLVGTQAGAGLLSYFGAGGKIAKKIAPLAKAAGGFVGRAFALGLVTLGALLIWEKREEIIQALERIRDMVKTFFEDQIIDPLTNTPSVTQSEAFQGLSPAEQQEFLESQQGPNRRSVVRRPERPERRSLGSGATGTIVRHIHSHIYLDGKKVAVNTTKHVEDALARA